MKLKWSALGGQAGLGFVVAGVLLLFLGWNGAASYDRVPAQFPYLISGGLAGVGLMVVGGALLIVQNSRADRAALQQGLLELREALDTFSQRAGASGGAVGGTSVARGDVVVGPTSFHRPTCALLDGRGALPTMNVDEALAAGLTPCRACEPLGGGARPAPTVAKKPAAKRTPAKKSAAKRAPAKKAAARKSPTKKSPARKRPAKKQPARRAR
jgi:hypothetical protein